jgi:hypothetical protein
MKKRRHVKSRFVPRQKKYSWARRLLQCYSFRRQVSPRPPKDEEEESRKQRRESGIKYTSIVFDDQRTFHLCDLRSSP